MIRNENEYQEAVKRLGEERNRIAVYEENWRGQNMTEVEVKRLMDPIRSFHLQLAEEVESYEKIKRREIGELRNLRGLGHLLISLRIALGLSQRDMAEKLDVHESQVSRDERNEYHGITLERAAKILEALDVEIRIDVDMKEPAIAE